MIDPNLISLALLFLLVLSIVPVTICGFIMFLIAAYEDYKKKCFHSLKLYSKGFIIVACIYVVLFAISMLVNKAPNEDTLITNYHTHKNEFNTLVKRIEHDQKKGLERIDDTWTRPEDVTAIGLTQEDVNAYRNEFKKLNIPRGFYAFPDSIDFIAYTSGLSISGSAKGYLFATKEPQNYFKENCGYSLRPLKNLNDYKGCNGYTRSYTIYQQIDSNWYIYEELED